MGHSLASFNKVEQLSPREASVAVEEGRIARMHGSGPSCRFTNDHYNHSIDEGDGTVNWLRARALVQILAWILLDKLPILCKPQFPEACKALIIVLTPENCKD